MTVRSLACIAISIVCSTMVVAQSATPDNYAIYSLILSKHTYNWDTGEKVRTYLIERYAGSNDDRMYPPARTLKNQKPRLSTEFKEAFDSYMRHRESGEEFVGNFVLPTEYRLADHDEIYAAFVGKDIVERWASFNKKFPASSGIVSLSSIGFDKKNLHAFLHVTIECGPLAGEGKFYMVEKSNDKWTIIREIFSWIS